MIRRYIDHLRNWSVETPRAPALMSPGRPALNYRGLWRQLEETARALRAWGLQPSDRIAVVLPDGPEMAACFLGVCACATFAPLNPAYSESEFDFYLSDLSAQALIVAAGMESPAITVARRRGLAVIELTAQTGDPAGTFRLSRAGNAAPAEAVFAEPEDVALVLHTSGTTSRPKIVPLTHANVVYSAQQIGRWLNLSSADRCLNMLPLFHTHGLIGALLTPLVSGGTAVCTPGFQSGSFLAWLAGFRPTWYTAAPTLHQTILKLATENRDAIDGHGFRFIRSCASPLPPKLRSGIEAAFGVPMVDAYGMTEACCISSNPLPPQTRKAGSVGVAVGVEVVILGEEGKVLGPGETGEIVIRGANVTGGYESNPTANEAAYTDGWFRTGDRGYRDDDGYIFIVGRIKEIIDRGGEKISPGEIDEALREHPDVLDAVAFSMPHPTLGEDVAAAVTLREGAAATERDIRGFAAEKLASFKVPRRIVIVQQIPKGPTGKPQRIGLAAKLGVAAGASPHVAPRTPLEHTLAGIWQEVLGKDEIGIEDDFFELGGDSIMATQVVSRLRDAEQLELPIVAFFDRPTITGLSQALFETVPANNGAEA